MKNIYLEELDIFKKSYQKSFQWTTLISIMIVVVCFTTSFFMADFFIKLTNDIAEGITENVEKMAGEDFTKLSDFQTFQVIFWNNLKVCTITIFLGIIPFYRLPSLFSFFQFAIIGVVFGGMSALGFNVMNLFIFSFLPHAIFELPAILYSVVIGNFINKNILTKIFYYNKKSSEPFGNLLKQSLKSYLLVVVPFLLIAAFIEGFITSQLTETFISY